MVKDGEVVIVDEFTGRTMPGRRYSDGLHQALEAKEGVKIERENQTRITSYNVCYTKLLRVLNDSVSSDPRVSQFFQAGVRRVSRLQLPGVIGSVQ